ncbi:MAG: hypothetical protein Kow0042_09580 [Calditrichia bacterium]
MKKIGIFIVLVLNLSLLAQEPEAMFPASGIPPGNTPAIEHSLPEISSPLYLNRYKHFYRQNVVSHFHYGLNYSGFSAALTHMRTHRMMYGFSLQLNQIYSNNANVSQLNNITQTEGSSLFLPILFNIKYHLVSNPASGNFIPYIIAGFGPALGLYFPYGQNFFHNLSSVAGRIGGGAYVGLGVDYLWQDEWAFSFDVRYNLFHFTHPLGEDKRYEGVSFFLGFSRALSD